jgi:hypothetical protein
MKWLAIVPLLLLTACQNTAVSLIAPKYKIVKAPDDLYRCPTVTKFPKDETLTDQEVGSLILKLHNNNITCKRSLDSIKQFYDDAENTLAEQK